PRANQVVTLQVDEYDAADQLIGSESYQADLWPIVNPNNVSAGIVFLGRVVNPAGISLAITTSDNAYRAGFLSRRHPVPGITEYDVAREDTYRGAPLITISDYVPGSRRRALVMTGAAEYAVGNVYG